MGSARTTWTAGWLAMLVAACGQPAEPAGGAPGSAAAPVEASPSPAAGMNLLLVTLDTTRADYISCLGSDPRTTPNLDALAARSALFVNATSETNVTGPSHMTIMSGLRAIEHGVHSNSTRIPGKIDTLASSLQRSGYETAAFIAAGHLAVQGWSGFDVPPQKYVGTLKAVKITSAAIDWLKKSHEKPVFTWVHYYDAHILYEPPKRFAGEFYSGDPTAVRGRPIVKKPYFEKRRITQPNSMRLSQWLGQTRDLEYPKAMYAAELRYVDEQVGRLFETLEELGAADDTVIVVVADHGESLGEHEIYYDHDGLYEPQLRIPLIVHVPGFEPALSDAWVNTLDITPTLAELLGLELENPFSGASLLPLLRGGESEEISRRVLIHQNSHNTSVAVRDGPWKLILLIAEDHLVLVHEPQLFHLVDDPGETNNLASAEPQRVAEMRELVGAWIQLGVVEEGKRTHLSEAQLEELRQLGYTD